jgi:hypothetical protein
MKPATAAGPVILIGLGLLLLANNLRWGFELTELIWMWWPMALILAGVSQIARGFYEGKHIAGGLILTLVGLAFQLHKLNPGLSVGELFRTYWPLALIAVGFSQLLMFGRGRWYGRVQGR